MVVSNNIAKHATTNRKHFRSRANPLICISLKIHGGIRRVVFMKGIPEFLTILKVVCSQRKVGQASIRKIGKMAKN